MIESFGVKCIQEPVDVTNEKAVSGFAELVIKSFGPVNFLINNAGVYLDQDKFEDSEPEQWWRTVEVNTKRSLPDDAVVDTGND